jgi:hypothetical protein
MAVFVMGGVMGAGIVFLLGGPLVGWCWKAACIRRFGRCWGISRRGSRLSSSPAFRAWLAFLVFLFREPQRRAPRRAGYAEALRFVLAWPRGFGSIIFGIGFVYTVTIAFRSGAPPSWPACMAGSLRRSGWRWGWRNCWPRSACRCTGGLSTGCSTRATAMRICAVPHHAGGRAAAGGGGLSGQQPWATVVLFGLYMACIHSTSSMGPAAVQVVSPAHLRGRISAIFVLVTGLIGMALGTFLVGFCTDHVLGNPLVGVSMVMLAVAGLGVAGCFFAWGCAGVRALVAAREG